jgi:ComF family protein
MPATANESLEPIPGSGQANAARWMSRVREGWGRLMPSRGGPQHADCALCGALRPRLASPCGCLCAACHDSLPRIAGDACPTCALPGTRGLQCGECLARKPVLDGSVAALRYAFPVPQMIARFKYGAQLPWADWAAAELVQAVSQAEAAARVDVVLAVPLAGKRLAGRGFNQAELMAEAVAAGCRLRHLRGALIRQRETTPQVGQDRAARLRNLRGVFASATPLTGLRVAVVDDVMTTGATLESLTQALRAAGALRVEGWVLARAEGPNA